MLTIEKDVFKNILLTFCRIKSFARKEELEFNFGYSPELIDHAYNALIIAGLLKQSKNGAVSLNKDLQTKIKKDYSKKSAFIDHALDHLI